MNLRFVAVAVTLLALAAAPPAVRLDVEPGKPEVGEEATAPAQLPRD